MKSQPNKEKCDGSGMIDTGRTEPDGPSEIDGEPMVSEVYERCPGCPNCQPAKEQTMTPSPENIKRAEEIAVIATTLSVEYLAEKIALALREAEIRGVERVKSELKRVFLPLPKCSCLGDNPNHCPSAFVDVVKDECVLRTPREQVKAETIKTSLRCVQSVLNSLKGEGV